MRLIDVDRLLDRCKFYHLPNGDLAVPIIDVQHAPTIEPERKKGEWMCSDDMYETGICSSCGWDTAESWINCKRWYNFCPNCGADMRGEPDV